MCMFVCELNAGLCCSVVAVVVVAAVLLAFLYGGGGCAIIRAIRKEFHENKSVQFPDFEDPEARVIGGKPYLFGGNEVSAITPPAASLRGGW